jgi:hypothetical protein
MDYSVFGGENNKIREIKTATPALHEKHQQSVRVQLSKVISKPRRIKLEL